MRGHLVWLSVTLAYGWGRSQTKPEIGTTMLVSGSDFGRPRSTWGSCGHSGSLSCFKFLPRCASIPPDLRCLIGALCHRFHSFSPCLRGFWMWTLPDATCCLYIVEIILPLWHTQKDLFLVRIAHLGQVAWEWGSTLWVAWVLQRPPVQSRSISRTLLSWWAV